MDYKRMNLSEIGTIVSGATPKTSVPEYFDGDIAWLTPADLSGYTSKYISRGKRNLTKAGYDSCSTRLMPKGTVLFSSRAPIGYVAIATNPICTNQGFKSIVPNTNIIDSEYLYYQLMYLRDGIRDKGRGTTFKEVSAKEMADIVIVVPSLDEQHCIVSRIDELFSELDQGVDTLQTIKQQLAVYRQAVLNDAFNTNAPARQMADIGDVCLGRQRSPKNVSNQYPTKYIRAANITTAGLQLDDVLEMEFTPTEQDKYLLKYGDIIVSEASGSATQVGKPAVWKEQIDKCCFQNTVIRLRLYTDDFEYVYWYLKYLYISGHIARLVGGVGINHLGAKKFSEIQIPIPDLNMQKQISERLNSAMSVCDSIEQTVDVALSQSEAMRQSILKKAFEGGLS